MVDDLLYGRVTSFRREQGFGVITLDDGRDIKFDASDCTMVPVEGEAVRLRVGPARWGGGFKALHVEPRGTAPLIVPAAPPALDQRIAALQRERLASALSEHVMAQLVANVFGGQLGDASLADVLDAYYAADATRARNDGYVRFARHHTPSDALAVLVAMLPGVTLPRAVSASRARDRADRLRERNERAERAERLERAGNATGVLHVQLPGTGEVREVRNIATVVALINQALEVAEDPRRLYQLDIDRDWWAFYLLSSDAVARLDGVLPLGFR